MSAVLQMQFLESKLVGSVCLPVENHGSECRRTRVLLRTMEHVVTVV